MAEYKQGFFAGDVVRTSDGATIPNDPSNVDRQAYEAYVASGGITLPYDAPPPITQVTPRQARLALLSVGLLDQVTAAVNAAGPAAKVTWEFATVIDRADPLMATLSAALGLTATQVDELFALAAKL